MRRFRLFEISVLIVALLVVELSSLTVRFVGAETLESPDRKFLFFEDRLKKKNARKKKKEIKAKQDKIRAARTGNVPFDLNAPNINFDSEKNAVKADGGLILSYGTAIIEAQQGSFGVESKEAELDGDVRITELTGNLLADYAKLHLNTGAGVMRNVDLYFEDGGYQVKAKEARRETRDQYFFEDATLTTCDCPVAGECSPWELRGNDVEITQNGYGKVWGGTLAVNDVPVFYFPYLIFPAKTERQSGLLPARFGNGSRNGFELEAPLFLALDDSTDATVTGILQTKTRAGANTEFRKIYSLNSKLDAGALYLNESARDGDLQGTSVSGLNDPDIDQNRFSGYLNHQWRNQVGGQPVQWITKGKYVSDDLLIREYEQSKIGDYNSRFVSSKSVVRSTLFNTYSAELSGEYNQAMVDDDDLVFHRAPQADIQGIHTFRPFGDNLLGAKLVLRDNLNSTTFLRKTDFDGSRHEALETLKIPFHFYNYFDGELSTDGRGSLYNLNNTDGFDYGTADTSNNGDPSLVDKSTNRFVPGFGYKMNSVLERVYAVNDGDLIKSIAELGKLGRQEQLVRVKHTIEPTVKYRFVPEIDQDENPQFDSNDRLSQRNVVTYELVQRLYGRFEGRDPDLYGIEESMPEARDLANLKGVGPLDDELDFGVPRDARSDFQEYKKGTRREIVRFKLGQSYDLVDNPEAGRTDGTRLSDLNAGLSVFANEYVKVGSGVNYNTNDSQFSSYDIETQLLDKRGDEVRARLNFIDPDVRQLEAGFGLRLTDRLKLGYYSRFDDKKGEFLESRLGLRTYSECKCWIFDLELSNKLNPDQTNFIFNITLVGLGEFGSKFLTQDTVRSEDGSSD